jgi:hypothetical protein
MLWLRSERGSKARLKVRMVDGKSLNFPRAGPGNSQSGAHAGLSNIRRGTADCVIIPFDPLWLRLHHLRS